MAAAEDSVAPSPGAVIASRATQELERMLGSEETIQDMREKLRTIADTAPPLTLATIHHIADHLPLPEGKDHDLAALPLHVLVAAVGFVSEFFDSAGQASGLKSREQLADAVTRAAGKAANNAADFLPVSQAEATASTAELKGPISGADAEPQRQVWVRMKHAISGNTLTEQSVGSKTTIQKLKLRLCDMAEVNVAPSRLQLFLEGAGETLADNLTVESLVKDLEANSAEEPLRFQVIRLQQNQYTLTSSTWTPSSKEESSPRVFKLLLVGDAGSGKSQLMGTFRGDPFSENYLPTIGVDFSIKTVLVNGTLPIKLQIWDTAGQARFKTIATAYFRGCHGIVVVFDVTNRDSFLSLDAHLKEIRTHGTETVSIIIAGNKADRDTARVVSTTEAQEKAKQLGLQYCEVSARDSNVERPFFSLLDLLLEQKEYWPLP